VSIGTTGSPAVIGEREFLGSIVRYRVRAGEHELIVEVPHRRGQTTHDVGSRLALEIDPRQVTLLR
jgi:hypothetical protein